MNLRAFPESRFLLKYLIIGLACLAFSLWAMYDGFYAFPNKIPKAQAYSGLLQKIEADPNLSDSDRKPMWKEIADENGWSSKLLSKDEYDVSKIESNIIYQYVFIAIGLGIGVPCLVWYLRSRKTWIESTSDGLRGSWGQELKISQIQKFDKKKWEKKGIGVLHYESAEGAQETFVIDDLKYERKTTDEIVRWIESQIPLEMIVNGLPEPIISDEDESEESNSDEDAETVDED
jgi:hypothetical protein